MVGAPGRHRTAAVLFTKQALCHLSYKGNIGRASRIRTDEKAVLQAAALDRSAIARKYQIRYSKISSTC